MGESRIGSGWDRRGRCPDSKKPSIAGRLKRNAADGAAVSGRLKKIAGPAGAHSMDR